MLTRRAGSSALRELKDVGATRLREGDSVLEVVAGSTKRAVAFFSNLRRLLRVPRSTTSRRRPATAIPVQKLFKLDDGERMVRMLGFDPRVLDVPAPTEGAEEPEPPFALAVTRAGSACASRCARTASRSTRSGRALRASVERGRRGHLRRCSSGDGDAVLGVRERDGHALVVRRPTRSRCSPGAGKGVTSDQARRRRRSSSARALALANGDALLVETEKGTELRRHARKNQARRARQGTPLVKRDRSSAVVAAASSCPL